MIELIWDRGRSGTVTAPSGASILVGDDSDFSPGDLAATAAAGCLMRTFLRCADEEGVPILSYASASHLASWDPDAPDRVVIRCYVVAAEGASQQAIERLLLEAVRESPICRMFRDGVTCEADIRCLCGVYAS